jgi:methyl-accepting chemotaxis protein
LKAEIEKLGSKLQDPAAEMTQNVVKDLQTAMGGMINEFKTSISGSAKSELEHLSSLLSQAGNSLVTFPETLKNMTDNLNENFFRLQEVVDGVAKRTLDQSTTSTEQMKRQVEEMSAILSAKVGDLQNGQEILITKQSENLQSSDSLLKAFNESISGLTNLSEEIAGSLASYQSVHRELNSAALQLRNVSENVGATTSSLKELQGKFVYNSEVFLQKNVETVEAVRTTLDRAKDVSSEFATKFDIIEKGLQGIFEQIDSGLKGYRDTIGESLQKYLSNYSEALTTTAGSLTAVVEKQEDILEELSEQISRIEFKR